MSDNKTNSKAAKGSSNWGVLGGYIGTIVGAMGWLIGFAIVCVVSGNAATLLRFIVPATAVSLGVAFLIISVCELAISRHGHGPMFQLALYGGLAWAMGLLLLLINHWIAPIINSSSSMMKTMREMNAVYQTNDIWATLLLAAGAVLLGVFTFLAVKETSNK